MTLEVDAQSYLDYIAGGEYLSNNIFVVCAKIMFSTPWPKKRP